MNLITKKETMISAYSHHGFLSEKGKKEKNYNGFLYITMLVAGLEPARTNVRQILSLLRLPIPPYQQIVCSSIPVHSVPKASKTFGGMFGGICSGKIL